MDGHAAKRQSSSQVYSGFIGKVCTLAICPVEPGCGDYTFLDQVMEDSKQSLDYIFVYSSETPKLNVSFDESFTVDCSVFSGSPCLVSTISKTSELKLVPSIEFHKL